MGRGTGTDPGGEKLREGNVVSAADMDPSAGPSREQAVKWDEPSRRMGSGGKTRSRSVGPLALWRRRTSREPLREDATCEEADGADSQDEPKTMKAAAVEQ